MQRAVGGVRVHVVGDGVTEGDARPPAVRRSTLDAAVQRRAQARGAGARHVCNRAWQDIGNAPVRPLVLTDSSLAPALVAPEVRRSLLLTVCDRLRMRGHSTVCRLRF